jgi:hypothetical protein
MFLGTCTLHFVRPTSTSAYEGGSRPAMRPALVMVTPVQGLFAPHAALHAGESRPVIGWSGQRRGNKWRHDPSVSGDRHRPRNRCNVTVQLDEGKMKLHSSSMRNALR